MTVSRRLRYEILRRDNHACRYCGATAPDAKLTVDHVVPIALGGGDEPTNLVCACAECNGGKSSMPANAAILATVSDDALRWAAAKSRAAEIQALNIAAQDNVAIAFRNAWHSWMFGGAHLPLPDDWHQTLYRFADLGLDGPTVARLADTALTNDSIRYNDKRFRYFCGCCWSVIREREIIAQGLLARDEASS